MGCSVYDAVEEPRIERSGQLLWSPKLGAVGGGMNRAIFVGVFALLLCSCSVDPNEQANKLFIEAQQLYESAQKQPPSEKLRILTSARDKLNAIVTKYPGSNLAVQLASGQTVGNISPQSLSRAISLAEWDVCVDAPRRACIASEALRLMQSVLDQFPANRLTQALRSIAELQAMMGLSTEAKETFDRVLQLTQNVDPKSRPTELRFIVEALVKAGMLPAALQVARSIENEQERALCAGDNGCEFDIALATIVGAQTRAGHFAEALETARAIKHEARFAGNQRAVAVALAQAGRIPEALQLAQAAKGGWDASGLASIAEAQMKAKLTNDASASFERALQLAQSPPFQSSPLSVHLLCQVAKAQARAGLMREADATFELALKIARSQNDLNRGGPLTDIAVSRASVGQIAQALQVTKELGKSYSPLQPLLAVAEAQNKAGVAKEADATFDEAVKAVQAIQDENWRLVLVESVIKALAGAGKSKQALQLGLAQVQKNEALRALVLVTIVMAMPS